MSLCKLQRPLMLALMLAGLSGSVFAVDGIILIDQNRALAGGVTPGDLPGFPVTITQPGSYRLASPLNVPTGQNGIEIASPGVTLDLNGFGITTPDVTTFPPFFFGIRYTGSATPRFLVIRNGNVNGFTIPIQVINPTGLKCQYCSFIDLTVRVPVGSSSFDLGNYTRIDNYTGFNSDVNALCPSVIVNSVARSISVGFAFPGDPNPASQGACTFVHNSVTF